MPDIVATIASANAETVRRILSADPVLVDVIPAREALPKLADCTILHSGPPIGWDRMCGPMRGAVAGIAHCIKNVSMAVASTVSTSG